MGNDSKDSILMNSIDDTDDLDPAEERAAWRLRELMRIKRDKEKYALREREREEIDARRQMDPEKRLKEDMERVKQQKDNKRNTESQPRFMQKYYHKGAFYQDEEILKRDYSEAVEDQVIHPENLPKPLQIRGQGQGLAGRSKWTHLANEDTTKDSRDMPWYDSKLSINKRVMEQRGGMKDLDDKKRRKD